MTTPQLDDLDADRVAAIDNSGWGRSFTFFQPRNLAFWVYLMLVVTGLFSFASMLAGQYAAYRQAIVVALVLFAVYGAIFWWFTHHIDRYARQPAALVVVAFLWGGLAATWTMAAHANDAVRALYAKAFGQAWALDWGAGLAAPFDEEIAKGVGLLLLISLAPRLVRTAFDGFILGAFIGLGFQIVEDVAYALGSAGSQFGANQVESAMSTVWMRMATGVSAHILYSAVFCAGLVYLVGRPAEPRKVGRGLALMATAMLLHGVWDSMAALVRGHAALLFVLMFAVIVIALVVAIKVFAMTVPTERQFLRAIMAPEVARGVLTAAELEAMCGDRRARKAFRKAEVGRMERTRAVHVLDAADELADELAAARGADTGRVAFARSELARIRDGAPPPSRDATPTM
ncbi:PrsW family intramembrane metalloprotease [Rhodococcus sp. NPDC127530]|uniref:PrsW family intramembrane metalloprotease n=1 Tax=unclassified Rhodococcus (in: high G+C Gram-positive bacteria) TaxID=192944 RepID=UPI003624C55F